MKIAFLCASLEPGRDAVGDYVRRLSSACAARGHQCRLFALNDRHVSTFADEQSDDSSRIERWPATLPWSERSAALQEHIASFQPDWISWQMVSYGYQPKGILGREVLRLARALRSPRTHVMLHEIWIGLARGDPFHFRLVGWFQRRALLAFLREAAPGRLDTSTTVYATALGRQGWDAGVLPVFSNIPVTATSPAGRAAAVARYLPSVPDDDRRLLGVTFGTLHRQWQPLPTARLLLSLAARWGRQPVLLAIGRLGPHGFAKIQAIARTGLVAATTGEIDSATVSCLLQAADLGIALHPAELTGKSGTLAAMLDHGLPVLMPRDDWRPRHDPGSSAPSDPRIARLQDLTAEQADQWLHRRDEPTDSIPDTAHQFLARLSAE